MPPYNIYGSYGPQGELNTQAQVGGQEVLGSQSGLDPILGLLGSQLGQSLVMKQQAALQSMDIARRQQALREADFGAGRSDARFSRGQASEQVRRQQEQDSQARLDREEAMRQWRNPDAALYTTTFGKSIGGPNIVPGLISSSGDEPGAVMTGYRKGPSTQGRSTMVGLDAYQGPSRASLSESPAPNPVQSAQLRAFQDPYANEGVAQRTARVRGY